ncbi:hypothetical protein QKW52_13825 [Bacillus sonorensis]|nr:hypothetical protein [Bacillus sonorensis]
MKRILQMTGIFLIAAAIILSGFIINDVTYDPFMEDSMSILFFTVSTYLSTPVFCMIGGCILLGISKLIDLQEKNNAILAEKLDSIFKQGGIAAQKRRAILQKDGIKTLTEIHLRFQQLMTGNIGTGENGFLQKAVFLCPLLNKLVAMGIYRGLCAVIDVKL